MGSEMCIRDRYQTVIEDWVQERGNDAPPLNGFFLGRAMDYPWISQHLAQSALRSPEWDLQAGTAKTGDTSRLVESFLLNDEFKQRLEKPFQHQSYSIGTVSIEKLAVAPINKIVPVSENPRQIVPLDALLYFKLVAAP